MRQRLLFLRDATFSGWTWLVAISNQLGAIALVGFAVGISILGAVKLPHWWWGLIILLGFFVVMFGEGAYQVAIAERKASADHNQKVVALQTQIEATEARKPRLTFKGTEVDRNARAVIVGIFQGQQRAIVDQNPASWSRVRIANDPGDGAGSLAETVAALVTFYDPTGKTPILEVEGRWASEKQAPEKERLGLSKEGRTVNMPANGDDQFPLDIAMKFDDEAECYAYNDENGQSGTIRLAKHKLVGTSFVVRVRVKGTNTERATGWFRLLNPPGQTLSLQAVQEPPTSTV